MIMIYEISLFVVNIFVSYLCTNLNLLSNLILIDALYSAINFAIHYMDHTLSTSKVIEINYSLYRVGSIERYFYYCFLQITYIFLTELCFDHRLLILKYLSGITLIPILFNNKIYIFCQNVFDRITLEKNNFIKKVLFEWISNTIIYLEKTCLNKQIFIRKDEIIKALENMETLKSNISLFFQNVLITYALIYFRNKSKIYYKLVKYLYTYGSGETIHHMTLQQANELFIDIISNKKYDQLIKPLFIQAIIFMYCDKQDSTVFKEYIKKLEFKLIITASLWTFASFVVKYYITIVVVVSSLFFVGFKRFPLEKKTILLKIFSEKSRILNYIDDRLVISNILTIIYGIFYHNPLMLCMINQFGGMIFYNELSINFMKILYILFDKNITPTLLLIHKDFRIIRYWIALIIYKLFMTYNLSLLMFSMITNFVSNSKYSFVILSLALYNNENNYFRLLLLGYLLAVYDGYLDYQPKKVPEDMIVRVSNAIIINDEHFDYNFKLDKETQTYIIEEDKDRQLELVEDMSKSVETIKKYNYLSIPTIKSSIKFKKN